MSLEVINVCYFRMTNPIKILNQNNIAPLCKNSWVVRGVIHFKFQLLLTNLHWVMNKMRFRIEKDFIHIQLRSHSYNQIVPAEEDSRQEEINKLKWI